jgi:ribosomal protein S28E/S33
MTKSIFSLVLFLSGSAFAGVIPVENCGGKVLAFDETRVKIEVLDTKKWIARNLITTEHLKVGDIVNVPMTAREFLQSK